MLVFAKFTDLTDKPILINPETITSIRYENKHIEIHTMDGKWASVRETLEHVMQAINRAEIA